MVYSFEGVDTEYVKTSRMTARKTPDGWRIERDRPSAGALAPWEYTSYKARTSDHFLALAPTSLKVGSLMKDLEKGRERMKRGLPGVKAPARLLVIVARNSKDTKALTKDYRTIRSLVAVAEAQVAIDGPAQRVVVRERSAGLRALALLRQPRRGRTPHGDRARARPLRDGQALRRPRPGLAERGHRDATPPMTSATATRARCSAAACCGTRPSRSAAERALSLTTLAQADVAGPHGRRCSLAFAYSYSSAAAFAIADKYGRGALLRLHTAFNSAKIKGRPGPQAVGQGRAQDAQDVALEPRGRGRRLRAGALDPSSALLACSGAMPELPEVETIRRHLAPHVEGRVLEAVDVLDERWCRPLAPAEIVPRGPGPRRRAARRAAASTSSGSSPTTSTCSCTCA